METKTLHPYLFVEGAASAIAWYTEHFGAVETLRVASADRNTVIHARLKIGDSTLMVSDVSHEWSEAPPASGPSSANLMLYVDDVDATQAQCLANGATELMPTGDKFWGERMGKIRDPFGHVWNLATVTEKLTADAIVERAKSALGA